MSFDPQIAEQNFGDERFRHHVEVGQSYRVGALRPCDAARLLRAPGRFIKCRDLLFSQPVHRDKPLQTPYHYVDASVAKTVHNASL